MDVFGFFKLRIEFVKQLHEKSCEPFERIKQQIENGVAPFEPPYSEDEEPPFLGEWIEADESIQVIGYSNLSILTSSFQLYFKTWEGELGSPAMPSFKTHFGKGWLNGYRKYFSDILGLNFEDAPVKMIRLEEIIRARNLIQHPNDISSNRVMYSKKYLEVIKQPYLCSESDRNIAENHDLGCGGYLSGLHVTPDKFIAALSDVMSFADWLDEKIHHEMKWYRPVQYDR